jgi:hypothetical protein
MSRFIFISHMVVKNLLSDNEFLHSGKRGASPHPSVSLPVRHPLWNLGRLCWFRIWIFEFRISPASVTDRTAVFVGVGATQGGVLPPDALVAAEGSEAKSSGADPIALSWVLLRRRGGLGYEAFSILLFLLLKPIQEGVEVFVAGLENLLAC